MKVITTYKPDEKEQLREFTEIPYGELLEYINEYDFEIYRGYKGIEPKGFFAKITDTYGRMIHIQYNNIEESKYVEHYLKKDLKNILQIIPVPDNYTEHISKTTIAVSKICKQMLSNIKEDEMSFEDVVIGLMAYRYYNNE